jgi:enterochelin esterase-like enzyme
MRVVVLLPARRAGERFPVLVTMHGRGEALKGPDRGARGWIDDYRLPRAIKRLGNPPLKREDFLSFVESDRLTRINAGLEREPYQGLIVVCPYTPDMLPGDDPFPLAPPLARFIVEELLPRVNRETPAIGSVESTGIDGVSLGGRAAVSVGLLKPEAFGAISALQAALDAHNAADISARLRAARAKNPKLKFRLLTSNGDFYLRPLQAISKALRADNLEHDFLVVPGPHDYDFNRGPGAFEMLLFHDRVLRGREGL